MKYCDSCGRALDDDARFCDCCGRVCEEDSFLTVKSPRRKRRNLAKKISAIMLVVVVLTVASMFLLKKNKPSTVKNADEAIAQLQELEDTLGYENALSELTEKHTTTIDGDSYYRLQQNYQGVPVYGRTIVYVTDENGKTIAITGNPLDVDPNINLIPTASNDEINKAIKDFLFVELGIKSSKNFEPVKLCNDDLYIYNLSETNESILAYCIHYRDYELIVDAHSGTVIQGYPTVYTQMTKVSVNGINVELNEKRDENNNPYYTMVDECRFIRIYNANHETLTYELYNSHNNLVIDQQGHQMLSWPYSDLYVKLLSTNGITQPVSYSVYNGFERKAIKLLSNLQSTYDFYKEKLFTDSINTQGTPVWIYGVYNDYNDGAITNAECWKYADYDMGEVLLNFGTDNSISIDTVAHEYTHAIERRRSAMIYADESGAIMEALSDIFGELVEYYQSKECDWLHNDGVRDMVDPSKSTEAGYPHPAMYMGENWLDKDNYSDSTFSHINSTVISHAAYLMSNKGGGTLNMDELAKLWYRAMLMMPSDCDFGECRALVELAAQSMGFTQKQIGCIGEAFDAVGIQNTDDVDFELCSDATLSVYDVDLELCGDYIISIAGTRKVLKDGVELKKDIRDMYNLSGSLIEEKYYETRYVTKAEAIPLDLRVGTYTITLIDNQGSGSGVSFTVYVGANNGREDLEIYTDFAKADNVALVTDAYANDYTYTAKMFNAETGNSEETEITCIFRIPKINLSGTTIEQINDEIFTALYPVIDNSVACITETGYFGMGTSNEVSYRWAVNGDILSLVVLNDGVPDFGGVRQYMVYNISISTGERVSNEMVIANAGMSIDEFFEKAELALAAGCWNGWNPNDDEIINNNYGDNFYEQLDKTVSKGNIQQSYPYMNERGELCLIARQYSFPVVAEYYWFDYNLVDFTPSPYYSIDDENHEPMAPVLEYPISEEDAYIIFKNFFPGFDDQDISVEVNRMGEGDNEMLFFDIKMEFFDDAPPMTWGFFNVYVNTGKCTGGAQGHESAWPIFQAEDYYY